MTPWSVAILDSGADGISAVASARFEFDGERVTSRPPGPDPLGHGSRVAAIINAGRIRPQFLVGQVLASGGVSTPAVVAAALLWAVAFKAQIIHLSLGLREDRTVLRDAIAVAAHAGIVIVAAAAARGALAFPAGYAGVLRGTGDARCSPDEISHLGSGRFGGAPSYRAAGGASIGAAHVTRAIVDHCPAGSPGLIVESALSRIASYHGPERRSAP